MVSHVELEVQRLSSIFLILFLGQVACLCHLMKHHIATLQATLRMADRIEIGRILAQAYQDGSLRHLQILRILTEIGI